MENGDKTKREESGADNNSQNSQALIDAINMRSMSLITLTSIATLYFIDWAQAVLLPLVVAVILLIGIIAGASIPLKQEAMAMLDKIPVAIEQFQQNEASRPKDGESMMEKAQSAAKKIEATASPDQGNEDASRSGATPVRVVDEPLEIKDYVLQGSPAALVLISQCFSALLLVYFVLAIGSLYRRKIVKISGPSFARMRKAARIMNEFHRSVRQFLFVMFVGAVFVGVLTWLAFLALGVEQAGFWGVLAGVASAVPYLGPFLVLMGTGVAAFIQFGELEMSIIVAGTSLAITSVQGYLLTPWLTSHISSLNAVAIFIGLLFWGWLWGPVGLVVATPILMIVKSLCDHVVNLRPVGELLGK